MKKLILLFTIFSFNSLSAQQFYNKYPSPLDLHIYTKTDVLELNHAYYKIESESNNVVNFHSDIRIIKTDASGSIIWAKTFDAGSDSSLEVTTMNKTLDNNIIICAELSNDNVYPPIGVSVFKLDTSGAVLWSVLIPGFRGGYYSRNTIQFADSSFVIDAQSSASLNSCVIKLNANATTASSKVFTNMVYTGGNNITSMILNNDTLSIAFNYGEIISTDTAFNVLTDRKYDLDPTGPYFTHAIAANGDYIFTSDIIAGGSLNGLARVFRTDASGNLKWAKSLTIWKDFTNHTPFNLYDVTQGLRVLEDTSQNIVVHLMDEGGVGLVLTFDANGNYITNKVIKGAVMKLCDDGDYVFVSNLQFANSLGIFGKQLHYSINDCDSLLEVLVSNGTDSISASATATISTTVPISLTNFPIYISSVLISPTIYCPAPIGISDIDDIESFRVFPNPFINEFVVSTNEDGGELVLYDVTGKEIQRKHCMKGETKFETNNLLPGFYLLRFILEDKSTFIKIVKL